MRSNLLLILTLTVINLISASMLGRDALVISRQNTYVDSALIYLVKTFLFEAGKRGALPDLKYLAVQFSSYLDEDADIIGLCTKIGAIKTIKINARYWESASSSQKEALMFHELAHCTLNREHCDSTFADGRYVSIMSQYSGKDSDYVNNREQYVNELFSKHERCK